MGWLRRIALALLGRYGMRLRYPHLLLLTGAAFALDLVLPDGLPFLDELVLGVMGPGGIAHFAHLGGMLGGFLMIRYWRGQLPFRRRR